MTLSGTSQVVWLDDTATSYTMSNTRDSALELTLNYIGKSNWGVDGPWWGAFDEFRIYHKALTSTEVNALYNWRGDTFVPMIILACPNPCAAGSFGGCTSTGAQFCTGCPAGTFRTGLGMLTSAGYASCVAGKFF